MDSHRELSPHSPSEGTPVLIKRSPTMLRSHLTEDERHSALAPLTIHQGDASAIQIDSNAFKGKMHMYIKGVDGFPEEYFRGKRRLLNVVVQGSFQMKGLKFSEVHTGQLFSKPLHLVPPYMLMYPFEALLSSIQPNMMMELNGHHPFVLSALMSTMQCIVVSLPGEEPDISDPYVDMDENMVLVGQEFQEMTSADRKSFLSSPSKLSEYEFNPDFVYTFQFYQDILDLSEFKVVFASLHVDIIRFLGSLPVQVMAVIWDPAKDRHPPSNVEYLYNIEIWHHRGSNV